MATQRSVSPMALVPGAPLVSGLLRVSWGRRLERGSTLVALAARVALAHLIGERPAMVILAVGAFGLVAHRPSRRLLAEWAGRERAERVVSRALVRSGALGGHEATVDAVRKVPAGDQLSLWVPVGTTVAELEKVQHLMAVSLGARGVRVVRDPAHAAHLFVTVAYRDPLSAGRRPWPWRHAARTDFW